MATGVFIPGNDETIDLQQQVARLQALLEASRQVHSTIREEEVLEQVLRIVVRELEMAGRRFRGRDGLRRMPLIRDAAGVLRFPLDDRDGKRMTELLVAPPEGREATIYEADFLEGLSLQAAVALENARNHKRNVEFARVQQDLDGGTADSAVAAAAEACRDSGVFGGLPFGDLLRGGRRLSRHRGAAGQERADGGGRCGGQGAGFGDCVNEFPVGVPSHGRDGDAAG